MQLEPKHIEVLGMVKWRGRKEHKAVVNLRLDFSCFSSTISQFLSLGWLGYVKFLPGSLPGLGAGRRNAPFTERARVETRHQGSSLSGTVAGRAVATKQGDAGTQCARFVVWAKPPLRPCQGFIRLYTVKVVKVGKNSRKTCFSQSANAQSQFVDGLPSTMSWQVTPRSKRSVPVWTYSTKAPARGIIAACQYSWNNYYGNGMKQISFCNRSKSMFNCRFCNVVILLQTLFVVHVITFSHESYVWSLRLWSIPANIATTTWDRNTMTHKISTDLDKSKGDRAKE